MASGNIFDWSGMYFKMAGLLQSSDFGITATSSGTQTTSYQLGGSFSNVATVAADNDGVLAPYPASRGVQFTVTNSGAHSLQVFAIGTDTLNGTAGSTGVAVAAGKTAVFTAYQTGAWVGPVALA